MRLGLRRIVELKALKEVCQVTFRRSRLVIVAVWLLVLAVDGVDYFTPPVFQIRPLHKMVVALAPRCEQYVRLSELAADHLRCHFVFSDFLTLA